MKIKSDADSLLNYKSHIAQPKMGLKAKNKKCAHLTGGKLNEGA